MMGSLNRKDLNVQVVESVQYHIQLSLRENGMCGARPGSHLYYTGAGICLVFCENRLHFPDGAELRTGVINR